MNVSNRFVEKNIMLNRLSQALLLASLAISGGVAAAAPPAANLDPTYGLPVPPIGAASKPVAGDWIWSPNVSDNQTIQLRKTFSLAKVPGKATIYITADDSYTLTVNGTKVSSTVAVPNGIVWAKVQSSDVTSLLKPGLNVIAVTALNLGGNAGVLAHLDLYGLPPVTSDGSWKVAPSPVSSSDWTNPGFDDSSWPSAKDETPLVGSIYDQLGVLTGWPGYHEANYMAHITLPVHAVRSVDPAGGSILGTAALPNSLTSVITVNPPPAGSTGVPSFVVDFGKEVAGRIMIQPLTSGSIGIGTGEDYEEAVKGPWIHTTLDLHPGIPSDLPYSAFRYVRLTFPQQTAPVKFRVALDMKYYPVKYSGSFSCSDPLITKIWYTGAYTTHLSMQELIWDAPKRDRQIWCGDLNVSGEVSNDVFADRFLMESTLTALRAACQGGPDTQLPGLDVNGIPGYSCAWISTLADYQKHIGDDAFLHKQHDLLISLLEYLRGETDSRNLFADTRQRWNFVDWAPGFDSTTPESLAATHMFLVRAVKDGAFLLTEMGDTENAAKYQAWASTLQQAGRENLADKTTNTYGLRLQENAMAVYAGVPTQAQNASIAGKILNDNSNAWDKTGTPPNNNGEISPYYGYYILHADTLTGHTEEGLKLLRSYWGGMLAEGATTFWEAYDPYWPKQDYHENLYADGTHGYPISLCHGWSAGPTAWLTDCVLGVTPTSGGFKTTMIQPELGDLAWAQGVVPTPHGDIRVRLDRQGGLTSCRVYIPAGVHATVRLPRKSMIIDKAGTYIVKG